jgi:hypothetical protein
VKKYLAARPALTAWIQWDGTNIDEFESLTDSDWVYLRYCPLYFVNNNDDLEMRRQDDDVLVDVLPLGHWSGGPGSKLESLESTTDMSVVEGNGPFHFVIAED